MYSPPLTAVTFPLSLRSIGEAAFWSCSSLLDVSLRDSLESIGFGAFHDCRNIVSVTFGSHLSQILGGWPSTVQFFEVSAHNPFLASDSRGIVWSKDFTRIVLYPPGRLDTTFEDDSAKMVGSTAFYQCQILVNVSLRSVIGIDDGILFTGDENLLGAFAGCSRLRKVEFGDSLGSLGSYSFSDCSSLSSVILVTGLSVIGAYAFGDCRSLQRVTIPGTVVGIGDGAFSSCEYLVSIEVPDSITELPAFCFWYCSSLESVRFPMGLRSIGSHCFEFTDLESIDLPDSVTVIGSNAFSFAPGANLSVSGGISGISRNAFDYDSLGTVTIRGEIVTGALCSALISEGSIGNVFGSDGLKINQSICNGTFRISGIVSLSPFPTVVSSPSPRATLTKSPEPQPQSSEKGNGVNAGKIVGIVTGEIALVAVSVAGTYFV
jgi:hypothetical protein